MHLGARHYWGRWLRVQVPPLIFFKFKSFFVAEVLEFDAEVEYQKTVIDKGLIYILINWSFTYT